MIPGKSLAWRRLMGTVEKIAPANAPVLIQEEADSAKELVAWARLESCLQSQVRML